MVSTRPLLALTAALSTRCDALLGADVSRAGLDRARARLRNYLHVHLRRMEVPHEWPEGRFDLVVIAEFAYYVPRRDLPALVRRAVGSLDDGGHLAVMHYLGPIVGYELDAVEVHATFAGAGLTRLVDHRDESFVLQVFAR